MIDKPEKPSGDDEFLPNVTFGDPAAWDEAMQGEVEPGDDDEDDEGFAEAFEMITGMSADDMDDEDEGEKTEDISDADLAKISDSIGEIEQRLGRIGNRSATGDAWDEGKHPRDESGRWAEYYHGSPSSELKPDFSNFNSDIAFFTKDPEVAKHYATTPTLGAQHGAGGGTPTVHRVQVDPGNTFDLRKAEHQQLYDRLRREYNAGQQDPDEHLPSLRSEGFLQRPAGLPGFGHVRPIMHMVAPHGFHSMHVWEGSQGQSLAVHNPQKRVRPSK